MAISELLTPGGTPAFLLQGHQQTPQDVFANLAMGSGAVRKRRLFTTAPRIVRVSWILEADQMRRVNEWFERTLQVGTLRFAARVAGFGGIGPDSMWFDAQWVAPFEKEPMHLGRWRVTGDLLLFGDGQLDAPVLTSFESEIIVDFVVRIALQTQVLFESEILVALDPSTRFRSEISVDLLPQWES